MTHQPVAIIGLGVMSAGGLSARETALSVRAGVSRFADTPFLGSMLEPIVMAHLAPDLLPISDPMIAGFPGISDRQARMLSLAGPALVEALDKASLSQPLPVILGMPDIVVDGESSSNPDLLNLLGVQCGKQFDLKNSAIIPKGRASGILAIETACELLRDNISHYVIVGGIDTFWDEALLTDMEKEGRISSSLNMDGFIPGEGAGFLLLSTIDVAKEGGFEILGTIESIGLGFERGHRHSQDPYLAEGLTDAFQNLFSNTSDNSVTKTVFAGFNGESFDAKQWGVAYIRNKERFANDMRIEHPADCIGDTGAAMAPIMISLAIIGMQEGHYESPSMVWCTSEYGDCGAVSVKVQESAG